MKYQAPSQSTFQGEDLKKKKLQKNQFEDLNIFFRLEITKSLNFQ